MSLTEVLPARTGSDMGAYAHMAHSRQIPRQARRPYAKTEPALCRPEDVLRARINDARTASRAAREQHRHARNITILKWAVLAAVCVGLMLTAGVGTLSFLVSESGHVPAVVRLVPDRAACAIVVRKC
jgi:hypothetical protein